MSEVQNKIELVDDAIVLFAVFMTTMITYAILKAGALQITNMIQIWVAYSIGLLIFKRLGYYGFYEWIQPYLDLSKELKPEVKNEPGG